MGKKIAATNKTALLLNDKKAQLDYLANGNPANSLPSAAISNCFPGLDYDFKEFWRRAFVGIVLLEWDNYVIDVEDSKYAHLKGHRLLKIDGAPTIVTVQGPQIPGGASGDLPTSTTQPGVVCMEWSNSMATVMRKQGQTAKCSFTLKEAANPVLIPTDEKDLIHEDLTVRQMLDGDTLAPDKDLIKPGELTQSLCSPWQHDYRECGCYYWPASRPDYVNVEPGPDGVSRGDNWLAIDRTGEYVLDDRKDERLATYLQLFTRWEEMLRFQVKGRDAEES